MKPFGRFSEDDIDPLIYSVLAADRRRVDVERVYSAILRSHTANDRAGSRRDPALAPATNWLRCSATLTNLSVAASLLCVVSLLWFALYPTRTSAYAVLSAADSEISAGVDRCYRIEVDMPKAWRHRNPLLRQDWHTVVWTRGGCFRAVTTAPDAEIVWGRDERRNMWVIKNSSCGLLYAPDEVPRTLARARFVLCFDVGRLMKHFLRKFDLVQEQPLATDGAGVTVIGAKAKSNESGLAFNAARLVIDEQNNVVRRMELSRMANGVERGTLTFVLVDAAEQPMDSYHVAGNLQAGAEILDGSRSSERTQAFQELFPEAGSGN